MSDEQSTPTPDDISALTPAEAASWLDQLGKKEEFRSKLLAGDLTSRKAFEALLARQAEANTAEQIVATTDAVPLPGGPNVNGMSARDLKTGVADLLANGLSPGSVAELLANKPVVTAEDFKILEREFNIKCLRNPEWTQALLAGDPIARKQLLAWQTIAITSRPLPAAPVFGVMR